MVTLADLPIPEDGKLADNITYFARALRVAGLKAGTAQIMDAICAIEAVGFTDKTDFYYTLRSIFVRRPEDQAVFAQVFRLFWRDPNYLEHMMGLLRPLVRGVNEAPQAKSAEKRAAEALLDGANEPVEQEDDLERGEEIEFDTTLTFSASEQLKSKDFEQMSASEVREAKRLISQIKLDIPPLQTRRHFGANQGPKPDWQKTIKRSIKRGGELDRIMRQKPRERYPNLIVLCDISGSMSGYSRMVLHLLHSIANQKGANWAHVYGFTMGTRLTNITKELEARDVDQTLSTLGRDVKDWEGGTRLADCLHEFNRDWSRRVMGSKAVVLMITDGLDQGDPSLLRREIERLQLSAGRLIWLNPLFRYDGFSPKARGIRAILPHVDCFRAGHNIDSLEGLVNVLANPFDGGEKARMMGMMNDG